MAQFEFNTDFDGEGDDEDAENGWMFIGKNATIFLIDCSREMFVTEGESEDSHFRTTMKCVHATISRKIIANDQDLYSVILFNTSQAKNSLDFPNIFVLQDLDRPGAERILELEKILEEDDVTFQSKHDGICSSNIHDELWVCRIVFSNCKSKLNTKYVLLFTCQDNPLKNDEHKRRQAFKGAKDLKAADIALEILPFGRNFNIKLFYQEFLDQDLEEGSEKQTIRADPNERFEELLERVRRIDHKHRSSGRVTFTVAPGVEMGVKVFTSIRKLSKPSKIKLYKVTNEEATSQKKEYLENGELLMPSDFVKFQQFGGKKIKFNLEEMKSLYSVYEPGIEILGFKKRSSFSVDMYIKPANFIYPDEDSIRGSRKLFACLLERCVSHDVCPVVRVLSRSNAMISWAFLLPQLEVKDEKGLQDKPPGFHVCYLPFADDFRSIELDNRTRANSDQVDAFKDVIKKLNFNYNPECFENPEIQTYWRNIETLALNRAHLEPVTDYTVPDHSRINKKAGKHIEEFKALVLSHSYDPVAASKKRPIPSTQPAAKRVKPDASSIDVEDMAKKRMVDKLTVDVLKQWLSANGIAVTGKKKSQLVQDIYEKLSIDT